jgi:hypothetical protein
LREEASKMPLKMKLSIVYRRCEEFMRLLNGLGYTKTISIEDLRYWIRRNLGSDRFTVKAYMQRLREFGFIKPGKGNIFIILMMLSINKQMNLESEKISLSHNPPQTGEIETEAEEKKKKEEEDLVREIYLHGS